MDDSSAETLRTSETFQITVMPGEPPRMIARWRGNESDGYIELDSLRTRTLHALVGLLRTNRLTRIDEFKLLGEYLFVSLFGPTPSDLGPRGLFMKAVKAPPLAGEQRRRLLQVSLEIDANVEHLSSWPWEYLYVPEERNVRDTDFFLGDRMNFMLSRRHPLSEPDDLENISPPLRILFVVLSPTGPDLGAPVPATLALIEYEAVLETLLKLRDSQGSSRIDLRVLTEEHADEGTNLPPDEVGRMTRATFGAFRGTVEDFEPHVVHIIGHGRHRYDENGIPSGQIAFPNTDSTVHWFSDRELADTMRDNRSLRLVFLQACEGAETQSSPYQTVSGLAQRLAQRGVPAIIAMHFQVEIRLANEFARSFYDNLAKRAGIEVAMYAARRHVSVAEAQGEVGRGAFGLPVLYLRESGALLTPLEVPTPPVRTVAESTAAEPLRPVLRDSQRDDDQLHLHPATIRDADRRHAAPRTPREDTDWRADQGLAPEHRERQ